MPSPPTRTTSENITAKQDVGRAGDPRTHFTAAEINFARWMIGSAGLLLPFARFTMLSAATTGALSLVSHFEAWDPKNLGTMGPTLTRSSAGVYLATYPTTADDIDGNPTAIVLTDAIAMVQDGDGGTLEAKAYVSANNVVRVGLRSTPGGTLADNAGARIFVVAW